MKNTIIIIIILFLLICVCVSIILGGLAIYTMSRASTNPNDTDQTISDQNNSNGGNSNQGGSGPEPITGGNTSLTKAPQIYAPEILFLDELYKQLQKTSWDGEGALPVKLSSLDQNLYAEMLDYESKRIERLTVPDSYHKFYLDRAEVNYLQDLLVKARSEYLDFLKQKGVNQKYIDEFDRNALPNADRRLRYRDDIDPNAPSSGVFTWPLGKDSSQRAGDFYASDIYNYARQIENSGVLGPKPQGGVELETYLKSARDMGLRMLAFHEFTHVLQVAYGTVNAAPADKGKPNVALLLDKPLSVIDQKYFLEWGSTGTNAIKNNQASVERQANGVSFLAMVDIYKLNSQQADILWEHRFGRLTTAAGIFNRVLPGLNKNYPKLRLDELDVLLNQAIVEDTALTAEQKELLNIIRARFSNFGADNGYYNTMMPADAGQFWDMLK